MKKYAKYLILLLAVLLCMGLSGCKGKTLTYEIEVSGSPAAPGVIEFLDYSINVYKDQASNSYRAGYCGRCRAGG